MGLISLQSTKPSTSLSELEYASFLLSFSKIRHAETQLKHIITVDLTDLRVLTSTDWNLEPSATLAAGFTAP